MRSALYSLGILLLFSFSTLPLKAQNGLHFDGNDDYVQTSYDGVTGTGNRSIEAWIKTTYLATQEVIACYGSMNTGQRFTLNLIAGKLRCEIGGQGVTGNEYIADNNWHHVAVTYDNSASLKFRLYVDGVLDTAYNLTSVTMNTSSATNFRIGVRTDGANEFVGTIDEVRFWNKSLTSTEINQNMSTEFCSPDSNLVAYYKFNEGSAGGTNTGLTNAYDASGNSNSGTLNNFALTGSSSNWTTGYPLSTSVLTSNVSEVGCDGSYTSPSGNYTWTTSGTYFDTVSSVTACDSIITIDLSFASSSSSQLQISECASYTSPSGSYTWTNSGIYNDTLPNAAGCDSVITIDLTIQNTYSSPSVQVCDYYILPSNTDTVFFSGTYHDTVYNNAGCDSIMTINVQVLGNASSSMNASACLSYTSPSGNYVWTSSGTYQDTLQSANGCDSIVTVFLQIDTVNTQVIQSGNLLSAQQSGATYQWVDCDNGYNPITGETGKLFTPKSTGNYAVIVALDGCSDTSACTSVVIVGLEESPHISLNIFPNPSDGSFTIQSSGSTIGVVSILDLTSKVLFQEQVDEKSLIELHTELQSDVYLLQIENAQGVAQRRLVIQ